MSTKKKTAFISLLLIMLFTWSGCSEEALPQIRIGCDNQEPYNYTNADGEFAGLDVDLAREACYRMGYEPVFIRLDWSERDTLLESGEIDCIWSCFSMEGQEDEYAWVGPYMRSRQVVAVLDSSSVVTLDDLKDKNVAVHVGSKAESIFLKQTDGNIPQVKKVYALTETDEIAASLRNDYVDAIAGYAATVREILQNEGVEFHFLNEELSHAYFGIAFSKNRNSEFRSELSVILKEMLDDGTTAHIMEKYGIDTDKALGGLSDE